VSGPIPERYLPAAHAALRIAAGLAYFTHGAQKLLGWFGGFGPDGGTVELMSRFGAAGVIELVCGALIVLGFQTKWAAFLASGEMAVAYFWIHSGGVKLFSGEGKILWWENRGELVMLYSFIFLAIAVWGSGPASVDSAMKKKA
jgi:putative oxidoreductase